MSDHDFEFLKVIEQDLPITSRPFANFAQALKITEAELVDKIQTAKANGSVRRYGGVLAHRNSGFTWNAMVVSTVPEVEMDALAAQIVDKKYVSHCYQRDSFPGWPYNFYMMVHAKSDTEGDAYIAELKSIINNDTVNILKSGREYKKSSLQVL